MNEAGEDANDGGVNAPPSSNPASARPSPESNRSRISLREIFFVIGTRPAAPSEMQVYETMERTFLGREFVFEIIGQSHHIRSRDGAFHELCSCVPPDHLDAERTTAVDLTLGNEVALCIDDGGMRYRASVSLISLDDFPRKRYDLAHRFAPDAYTAIDLSPPFFETYHTYPERDLTVRTRTKLALPGSPGPAGD